MNLSGNVNRASQASHLYALYTSTSGSNWKRSYNWGNGDPCFHQWYGVDCDCDGNVIAITLPDNRLVGSLPLELGLLTSMIQINLQTTNRASQSELNNDANRISGSIPSLAGLTNLKVLDVSMNSFSSLPSDIGSNVALEVLSASGNQLTSFPSINALVNMKILDLSDNQITSVFPTATLCALSNIYILNLGNNRFSGTFYQPCLNSLNPLVFDISGPYPEEIGTYQSLTGDVPKELTNTWTNIEDGYLSVYQQFGLTGHIPNTCIDLRFCHKANFGYHADLAWISGGPGDVPQYVYDTIALAPN